VGSTLAQNHQCVNETVRQRQSQSCSHEAHDRTLGEKLLDQSSRSCSDRGTHRVFVFLTGGARQHQINDVDTRDEQDGRDRGQKDQQQRTRVADEAASERG